MIVIDFLPDNITDELKKTADLSLFFQDLWKLSSTWLLKPVVTEWMYLKVKNPRKFERACILDRDGS